ncbi:MAG TPA: hypothetical protein VFR46_06150, partial [Actinomycetes bacterium]|nr:hypothetical protein [Actinomycetes bacterium]
ADFDDGSADGVIDGLDEMAASSTDPQHGSEPVQAAAVLLARGDSSQLEEARQLAAMDWHRLAGELQGELLPEPHIGPFAFSRLSYEATLTDALHRYEELASH